MKHAASVGRIGLQRPLVMSRKDDSNDVPTHVRGSNVTPTID
jgi:hypothetical protein